MNSTIEKLGLHSSTTPSKWKKEGEYRLKNKTWLRYSQMIAMKMLDKMESLEITQKNLAERMGCSQQYISKILQGRENLSLETLAKIEDALQLQIVSEEEFA